MKNAAIIILAVSTVVFAGLALRKGQPHSPAPASSRNTENQTGTAPVPRIRLGYVTMDMNNQYWRRVESGMKAVSQRFHAELAVRDPKLDSTRQLNEVEDLLQTGVEALLISPINDETCTKVQTICARKKVPVIIVDVGAGQGDYACLTISDNKKGGYLAGKFIREKVGGSKPIKVGWLQIPQAIYAGRLRSAGFAQAVKEFGFEVVGKQEASHRKDVAVSVMEDILVRAPDLHAVFCENDEMALGALQAIKAARKLDQVIVAGFDGNPNAIESIQKGELAATVAQDPELMGRMAIVNAYRVLGGTLDSNARVDIYVPIRLITKNTLKKGNSP